MELPKGYIVRSLEAADYSRGLLTTLTALTTVGDLSEAQFSRIVNQWSTLKTLRGTRIYNPIVIVDTSKDQIAATGMLFIEEKLIHGAGYVGHIEDIAVAKDHQGKQFGKFLINELTKIAKESGTYKVILDCDPKNIGFYEKCGYSEAGAEMQKRF